MPRYKYKREDVLSQKEVANMIEKAGCDRDKCLVALLYITGCRISEILGLKRKNFLIKDDYLYIDIAIKKRKEKGGIVQPRHKLPFNIKSTIFIDHVLKYVASIDDSNAYIIYGYMGKPLDQSRVWHILRDIHGSEISAHLFRKTRLTRLCEAGANPHQLKNWAGHTDLRSIEPYLIRSVKMIKDLGDNIE